MLRGLAKLSALVGAMSFPAIASADTHSSSVVVYLRDDGGRVYAGKEHGPAARSHVLSSRGISVVDVPAYSRGDQSWRALVTCVRDQFDEYDIEVVDERPSTGNYIVAMVGGHSEMLGLPKYVGGIAPYNGRRIDDGVVFVFEASIPGARQRCEATAHEIGHVLGLDHSTLCSDLMSYGQCGPKAFRERAARCGEFGGRRCSNGASEQSSREVLANLVGLREEPVIASVRRNVDGPEIMVVSAPPRARANATYQVRFRARDPHGIAAVELLWSDSRNTVILRCDSTLRNQPVRCIRRGDIYTFAVPVGHGDRNFAVRVTDGNGHSALTRPRTVRLSESRR
jgi:hypothetical protein